MKRTAILFVIIVIAVVSALQWRWLMNYRIFDLPPSWDQANFHTMAVTYYNGIKLEKFSGFKRIFLDPAQERPQLLPISTLLFYSCRPYRVEYGHIIILAFSALYIISTYILAAGMLNRTAGVFSVLYLTFFPATLTYSREFLGDLPAGAFICLAMLCLIRSEFLYRIGWTIGFAVSLGLAMNLRNFAGAYLLFPFIYALYRGAREHRIRIFLRIAPAVLIGAALLYPWYYSHMDALTSFFTKYTYGSYARIHLDSTKFDFFTPSGQDWPIIFNLRILLVAAPSLYFGVLIIALCVMQWRRKGEIFTASGTHSGGIYLLLWVTGSLVILSLISNVSYTYMPPVMPAMAIGIEYLAARIGRQVPVRMFATITVLAVGTAYLLNLPAAETAGTIRMVYRGDVSGSQINTNWRIPEILDDILKRDSREELIIGIIGSHPFFSQNAFKFDACLRSLPIVITNAELARDSDIKQCLLTSDYIIIKTGFQAPSSAAVTLDQLHTYFNASSMRYHPLPASFNLPDGSTAFVYRHAPASQIVRSEETSPTRYNKQVAVSNSLLNGLLLNPVVIDFGGQIELLGAFMEAREERFYCTYFWHCLKKPDERLKAFIHFIDRDGRIVSQGDYWIGGDIPTTEWKAGDYVTDGRFLFKLTSLQDVSSIAIGLWPAESDGNRLVVKSSTVPTDDSGTRALVPIELTGSVPPSDITAGAGREFISQGINFNDLFFMTSCTIEDENGSEPRIRYIWRSLGKPSQDYKLIACFTDPDGKIIFMDQHFLLDGRIPASQIKPGEWVSECYRLTFAARSRMTDLDIRVGIQPVNGSDPPLQINNFDVEKDQYGTRIILRYSRSRYVSGESGGR